MPLASVCNVDTAGGLIRPLQTGITIDGNPWAVVGSPVDPHSPCEVPDPPHCAAVMAEGVGVTINGINVCVAGNAASCGHPATGSGFLVIVS